MDEKLDFKKLSRNELLEILRRQEKLLAKKKFLNSLPDKGKKITDMVMKLQQLIIEKEQLNATMGRFQQISISQQHMSTEIDSDDDNDDDQEVHSIEQDCCPGSSLSTIPQDKVSAKILKVSKMVDMSTKDSEMTDEKLIQVQKVKPSKVWDYESAVTSPHRQWKVAQMLPLEESLKLQEVQQREYEELQTEHARHRLKEQVQAHPTSQLTLPRTNTSAYREQNGMNYDEDESDDSKEGDEAEQSSTDED